MRSVVLGVVAAGCLTASSSFARDVPSAQWSTFIAESNAQYDDEADPADWEAALYDAATEHRSQRAAIAAFAASISASLEEADLFADAITRAVALQQACGEREGPCRIVVGSPDALLFERASAADVTGRLLSAIMKSLTWGPDGADPFVADLVEKSPAAVSVLGSLHAYNEDRSLLARLILKASTDPVTLQALQWALKNGEYGAGDGEGWMTALLVQTSNTLHSDKASPQIQAQYARATLYHLLALGLSDEAVATYRGLSDLIRAELFSTPEPMDERQGALARGASEWLADELVATLWAKGDPEEARAFLAYADAVLGARIDNQGHAALLDALDKTRSADSLFDLYITGDPDLPKTENRMSNREAGWMQGEYGPQTRQLIVERLTSAGYASIANNVAKRGVIYPAEADERVDVSEALGSEARAWRSEHEAEIEANRLERLAARATPVLGALHIPDAWSETALPTGVVAWRQPNAGRAGRDQDEAFEALMELAPGSTMTDAEARRYPVRKDAIIRAGKVGGDRVIIYRSARYDLPGETGAYGLWAARQVNGRWGPGLYLGLQERFPYVVTPTSNLPLIEGDTLQMEVQVRDVDPASITFPPVGLRYKREQDGRVLSARWSDLERDSDGDSLTDIAEARLLMNVHSADTDGDGLTDAVDPLPQVPFDAGAPVETVGLARAILTALTGHDVGAIGIGVPGSSAAVPDLLASETPTLEQDDALMIVADPSLFARVSPSFRTLVYNDEQVAQMSRGGAPFYPPKVEILSSLDGRRHYVIWSASWVGGEFLATCAGDDTRCDIEEKVGWIT